MAYMGNRWGAPPPHKPKTIVQEIEYIEQKEFNDFTEEIEYIEKKEFNDFADNVRHDLVKIVDFINQEVEPEVTHIRTDLDETMNRTDVMARNIYDLQHEVRMLREKGKGAPATKRRLRVTVCAGKDKVQITRND